MMKHFFKTITTVLLLVVMAAVVLTGCNTSDPTATPAPIPEALTKDEANPLFAQAIADTIAAKSMNFSVIFSQNLKTTNGETENEVTYSEKISGTFMTDSDGNAKAHLNTERKQNNNTETTENYLLNGKLYYNGEVVSVDPYSNSINIDTIIKRYLSFTDSYDSLLSGIFDERIADCFTINERTISVSINDVVKFVEAFAEDSTSESELDEIKQMLTKYSFALSCTLGEDGYISSIDFNIEMDATQDEVTSNQIMSFSATFSQVNKVEDKEIPTWLDEYLKNPENFADRLGYDEYGQLAWYEVDTTANGSVTKTVRHNADGSVVFYREYTHDDMMRKLTDIKYSADGSELEKYIWEYEDNENGEQISFTERYYENGELKTVLVYNYLDNSLSSRSYYENGVKIREEYWSGDITYYHYTPNGELFCYEIDERFGGYRYFDGNGNELTYFEYYELTYTVDEYDDNGKCIKKTEYNIDKQIMGIITLTYDVNGNLASESKTDEYMNKLWEKTYHANGSLKDDIEYPNYAFIIKKVKSYGEDGTFLTETIYENSGDYVVYYYNGKDQYTKIDRFNAEDKLSYSADYDEKGRLIKESSYNPDGSLIGYSIHEYYSETNSIVTRYDTNGNEIGKYDTGDYGSGG